MAVEIKHKQVLIQHVYSESNPLDAMPQGPASDMNKKEKSSIYRERETSIQSKSTKEEKEDEGLQHDYKPSSLCCSITHLQQSP